MSKPLRSRLGTPSARALLGAAAVALALNASAAPGDSVFSAGGPVTIQVLPAGGAYTSELWLYEPGPAQFLALSSSTGAVVPVAGVFPAGTELVFGIYVIDTGFTYRMGPGSRNPDGVVHADVDFLAPGVANVGFEDLYGGGDLDYDDMNFQFVGVAPTALLPPVCDVGPAPPPDCELSLPGATASDDDSAELQYSWTSSDPDVVFSPASGMLDTGPGVQPIPPTLISLAAEPLPCLREVEVRLEVTDESESSACSQLLLFADLEPPLVSGASADTRLACLWPPNHRLVPIDVASLPAPDILDGCGHDVVLRLVGCESSQPDEAPADGWNGDGRTERDCILASDGSGVLVRSERAGSGAQAEDGRFYFLTAVAEDACGNVTAPFALGHVHVPHDQSPAETDCLDAARIGLKSRDEPSPD